MKKKIFPHSLFSSLNRQAVILALFVGFVLCLHGITWGRVEEWNSDQVGMRCCFSLYSWESFNPNFFLKPPFHSYVNFFVSLVPATAVSSLLELDVAATRALQLIWSRVLTVVLFLVTVGLIHGIAKKNYGLKAANISTLLFVTSAGILSYTHFLTADIPLLFWMVLSFYAAERTFHNPTFRNYLITGFLIGLATATKYNGILIGVSLVVFHFYSHTWRSWKSWFNSKLLLSGLSTILGFIVGNPFSVIDYKQFAEDFYYLAVSESVFMDTDKGGSYLGLPAKIADLIGYPVLLAMVIIFALAAYFSWKKIKKIKATTLAAMSVIAVFIVMFGNYSFILKHYLLPIIPFLFLLFSSALAVVLSRFSRVQQNIAFACVLVMIGYNLIASWFMGQAFLQEPRMQAQSWVINTIPPVSVIETSTYVPDFNLLFNEPRYITLHMPQITGRISTLMAAEADDQVIVKKSQQHEGSENREWYKPEAFVQRNPDYVAINSSHYFYGFIDEEYRNKYPEVHNFFEKLLNEQSNYEIVFDQTTQPTPWYLYPQEIDFLKNRVTILQRKQTTTTESKPLLILSESDVSFLLADRPCSSSEITPKKCFEEISVAFQQHYVSPSHQDYREKIVTALSSVGNQTTPRTTYSELFDKQREVINQNQSLFFSILFYNAAIESAAYGDTEDVETFLILANTLSPSWSYFPVELANFYLHQQQPSLARTVIQSCYSNYLAKDDCMEFYRSSKLSHELQPIGFKYLFVSHILQSI